MPMTAKMKMMMHKTKVKLPRAPTVLPMMEMSKLSVGHDFANLNTRSCFFFKERTNLLVFFAKKKKKKITYQSEGTEDGEAGNAFESELEERQEDDDEIENVPSFLEVEFGADGDQLEESLDGERGREELNWTDGINKDGIEERRKKKRDVRSCPF